MGYQTRDQIVSNGLQVAGNTSLTALANDWLQTFLDRVYAKYDWPFLAYRRYGPFSLAQGMTSAVFGDGSGAPFTCPDKILSVKRIELAGSGNNSAKSELEVVDPLHLDAFDDPLWLDSSAQGLPQRMVVEISTVAGYAGPFQWQLSPSPVPGQAYRVIIQGKVRPAVLSAGVVPIYPGDDTMVHAVTTAALKYQKDAMWPNAMRALSGMVSEDLVIYGHNSAQPGRVQLARRTFQQRRPWTLNGDPFPF